MIEIDNLEKSFSNKTLFSCSKVVLKDQSLVAIIGESGCGKTTLLNMLSLIDNQYKGSIKINGVSYQTLKGKKKEETRSNLFSFVFSHPYLIDYLSVEENILFSSLIRKTNIDNEKLNKYIQLAKLESCLDSKVTFLSEGEKQRISIVRALVYDRKFLICDEPTAHLDPNNAKIIVKLLKDISQECNKTVIVALHDYSLLPFFDEILEINDRKLNEINK